MIQVTVKLKGWGDKRLRKHTELREDNYPNHYVDEELEAEKLMELARVLRENLSGMDIEKVRIDIKLAADCGCIQHIDE